MFLHDNLKPESKLCINAHSYMIVGINIYYLYYTTVAIELLQSSNQMYLENFQHVIFSLMKSVGVVPQS